MAASRRLSQSQMARPRHRMRLWRQLQRSSTTRVCVRSSARSSSSFCHTLSGLRARTSTCGWQDACTQRRCCVWRGAARRNSVPHRRCAPPNARRRARALHTDLESGLLLLSSCCSTRASRCDCAQDASNRCRRRHRSRHPPSPPRCPLRRRRDRPNLHHRRARRLARRRCRRHGPRRRRRAAAAAATQPAASLAASTVTANTKPAAALAAAALAAATVGTAAGAV